MTAQQRQIIENLASNLVLKVMRDFGTAPGAAMNIVFNSDLFAQLCDVASGRYQDGTVCLYSDLKTEIRTGSFPAEY